MRLRRLVIALSLLAATSWAAAACGGGSAGNGAPDGGGTVESGEPGDSGSSPLLDVGGVEDTALPDDVPSLDIRPTPDLPSLDVPPLADLPPGTGQFGDPCGRHIDCESGLCWRESVANGCTAACTSDEDCATWGLQCVWLGEGMRGCGAPRMTGNPTCTSHADCLYPYVCLAELGLCGLPECRWNADCPAGRHCNTLTRRCEDDACAAIVQCTFPLDYCIEGTCQPATCTESSECPAGESCSPVYGSCRPAPPCDEEGACTMYNEVCLDGLCAPNLCANDCADERATCEPSTGHCHLPCAGPADCREGEACDGTMGWCYENRMPAAVARVDVGGTLKEVATVAAGSPVQLDGTGSVDPDGAGLTYVWTVDAVPPGSPLVTGETLPGSVGPRPSFQPAVSGLYAIGLTVTDGGGLVSYPAETIVVVP